MDGGCTVEGGRAAGRAEERKGDGKRDELEGKMNSRWQSDNPVRSIGISAGRLALHTRAAYIETRLYIERNGHVRRSPGRRGAAQRESVRASTYVWGRLHKRVCDSLRTTGTHVLCMNAYTGWARFSRTGTFQGSTETKPAARPSWITFPSSSAFPYCFRFFPSLSLALLVSLSLVLSSLLPVFPPAGFFLLLLSPLVRRVITLGEPRRLRDPRARQASFQRSRGILNMKFLFCFDRSLGTICLRWNSFCSIDSASLRALNH